MARQLAMGGGRGGGGGGGAEASRDESRCADWFVRQRKQHCNTITHLPAYIVRHAVHSPPAPLIQQRQHLDTGGTSIRQQLAQPQQRVARIYDILHLALGVAVMFAFVCIKIAAMSDDAWPGLAGYGWGRRLSLCYFTNYNTAPAASPAGIASLFQSRLPLPPP